MLKNREYYGKLSVNDFNWWEEIKKRWCLIGECKIAAHLCSIESTMQCHNTWPPIIVTLRRTIQLCYLNRWSSTWTYIHTNTRKEMGQRKFSHIKLPLSLSIQGIRDNQTVAVNLIWSNAVDSVCRRMTLENSKNWNIHSTINQQKKNMYQTNHMLTKRPTDQNTQRCKLWNAESTNRNVNKPKFLTKFPFQLNWIWLLCLRCEIWKLRPTYIYKFIPTESAFNYDRIGIVYFFSRSHKFMCASLTISVRVHIYRRTNCGWFVENRKISGNFYVAPITEIVASLRQIE